MDLSKLPKLSKTRPGPAEPELPPPPISYGHSQLAIGAEIWISLLLGVFFIYFCSRPLEYLFTRAHPEKFGWTFNDANGNPLSYLQTVFFLPDLGVCVLGFILIFDALQMILARSVRFAIVAFALTIAGTSLNIAAMVASFLNGSGFQVLCFLGVAFGGATAAYQLNAIRALRYARRTGTQ